MNSFVLAYFGGKAGAAPSDIIEALAARTGPDKRCHWPTSMPAACTRISTSFFYGAGRSSVVTLSASALLEVTAMATAG